MKGFHEQQTQSETILINTFSLNHMLLTRHRWLAVLTMRSRSDELHEGNSDGKKSNGKLRPHWTCDSIIYRITRNKLMWGQSLKSLFCLRSILGPFRSFVKLIKLLCSDVVYASDFSSVWTAFNFLMTFNEFIISREWTKMRAIRIVCAMIGN